MYSLRSRTLTTSHFPVFLLCVNFRMANERQFFAMRVCVLTDTRDEVEGIDKVHPRIFNNRQNYACVYLTLAESLRECIAGSCMLFPEAAFVEYMRSCRAEATSFTALRSMT